MRQIDKYIGRNVFTGILLVLLILVGLFTFFSFIDEIDDIGKQSYGIWQAVQYIGLEIPRHIYDLFPTAALLGSLIMLGVLASNSELTVMRASGISITRIALSVLKIGGLLTLVAMLIGEFIAPYSEQYGQEQRALAQSEKDYMAFSSRYSFWARDQQSFINIRTILPNGGFGQIALYEFTPEQTLTRVTYAQTAHYEAGQWVLNQVEKVTMGTGATEAKREFLPQTTWKAILDPELIKIVVVKPRKLSSLGLYHYIQYLKQNGQESAQYELAFWTRLAYPLLAITMIFLAIPFVFGSLRNVAIGQRILVGAFLGIGFHMLNQIFGHLAIVYHFPVLLSAFLPPLLFLSIALLMMRRAVR